MLLSDKWWIDVQKEIKSKIKENFGISYPTKIVKIVISSNVNGSVANKKLLDNMVESFEQIVHQKPLIISSRKSITSFKIREGNKIGCKVTIRGKKMIDFIFRLIYVFAPSIRGFSGFSLNSFDKDGNFTIGINDLSIFPDVNYNLITISSNQGFQINFVFSSNRIKENQLFFECLKFPFKNKKKS